MEGTTGREKDVACNLVDTEATGDVATLMRLLLQFLCPTFFNTLVPPIKIRHSQRMHRRECTDLSDVFGRTEAPAPVDIRLTDFVTSVTAAVRVDGQTTITGTTVARGPLFIEPIEVVARVGRVRIGDLASALVKANFEDLVGNIALNFPAHVHDV